ncbi:WD40 repeat domain-containing protein [Candidatus Magnetobacterium casense]|uniref:WD40 repeat domain-containing protein n=1 Tax=Candidatus Magnetobacterium casense TaxID=1455061 RepID=A0ABS6RX80_9BACT|nr:WD40 repeat domain-containing protein [Candidatus Magnetobacterium casensis]MBV6341240.1 WD40 repeat domain-containing protein [Candidatus Magnetobacterium casensis]
MDKIEKPEFRLKRVYSNGSSEDPCLYGIEDIDSSWQMGRRGFLITSIVGLGVLNTGFSASIASEKKPKESIKDDVLKGNCPNYVKAHTGGVTSVSFSPDGKILASCSYDETIKIWNIPSGDLLRTLKGHEMCSISFSPDGKFLASGSCDSTIKIWEMPSGDLLSTLEGRSTHSVSFSPDGKLLAAGSNDKTIKIWDMDSMKFITCLLDPKAMEKGNEANQYTRIDEYGRTITYTLPCGTPIPPGAICTCNCVPGSYSPPASTGGGGTFCTCDTICTCVPIK